MSIGDLLSFTVTAVLLIVFVLSALTLGYLTAVVLARSYQRLFRR